MGNEYYRKKMSWISVKFELYCILDLRKVRALRGFGGVVSIRGSPGRKIKGPERDRGLLGVPRVWSLTDCVLLPQPLWM